MRKFWSSKGGLLMRGDHQKAMKSFLTMKFKCKTRRKKIWLTFSSNRLMMGWLLKRLKILSVVSTKAHVFRALDVITFLENMMIWKILAESFAFFHSYYRNDSALEYLSNDPKKSHIEYRGEWIEVKSPPVAPCRTVSPRVAHLPRWSGRDLLEHS